MVMEYVNRCFDALQVAVEALSRSDYDHVRTLGHRLRGSGGAYGIPVLAEIGSAIEEAAGRVDATELSHQLAALVEYLSRIEIDPKPAAGSYQPPS